MADIHRIALVGAGQLGSRHLQGMARLETPCEFHVVDPSPTSLETARQRLGEVPSASRHAVHLHASTDTLPRELDHLVVSTTADVRLAVLRKVLDGRRVRNALLEKVLFQRVSELDEAQRLLEESGTRAWVNCPRRIFPIHRQLRDFFAADRLRHVDVRGGGWGLGCNSLHFVDLVAFLADAPIDGISTSLLDPGLIDSKRSGFKEFTGTLSGRCGDASFDLTSLRDSSTPLLLTFRGERRSAVVDETAGRAFFCDPDGEGWRSHEFRAPLLSEIAADITSAIIGSGYCSLAPYALSAAYHRPLLTALGRHAARTLGTSEDFCPIT
jgi:predicted dehydrogenase